MPNAQPNSWGLPYGSGPMQMFLFSCRSTHHTFENALATGAFVVNLPSVDMCKCVMRTVRHYPRGVDEIVASGLTPLPSKQVIVPGIAECKVHLECTVLWHHTVPLCEGVADAVIAGQIVAASADRDVLEGPAVEKLAAMATPGFVLALVFQMAAVGWAESHGATFDPSVSRWNIDSPAKSPPIATP